MTQQMLPFQKHSATSRAAAIAMLPKAGTKKRKVLEFLWMSDAGLTDDEGIAWTGIEGSTYRPRRIDLVKEGLVMDSGERRPTHSGQLAVVWVAC